ncbi:hypothetical protein ABL78_2509 [Leptomonas seymouri]|uniref:Uncharacterized protein n=1 Tax=Leptomonas seymouri TaxID=5684 RepID=A0A0N1I0S2_LEPSE|nr:hypothetical protein ABL78_2509 [Leptomonas seymouri]|eukprot:KPI88390.1 hypothetical protein ABL78_2509 [Leptomonas seymouri]
MSRVSVAQFITEDGKIQIDVTNTSGHAQSLSREPTAYDGDANHLSTVRDHDEPCSLIVSLRSSHPQFFFLRSPQRRLSVTPTHASSLLLLDRSSGAADGVGGRQHRHSGSALWKHEVVDTAILDVSRQTWRECGFPPVAPDTDSSSSKSKGHRGGDSANHRDGHTGAAPLSAPEASAAATVHSDSRPLLVREEVADCVLLPGERRVFCIEVNDPSVLSRLVAPKKPPKVGDRRLQQNSLASCSGTWGGGTAANEKQDGKGSRASAVEKRLRPATPYPNGSDGEDAASSVPQRELTEVFHVDKVHAFPTYRNSGAVPASAGALHNDNVRCESTPRTPNGCNKTLPWIVNGKKQGGHAPHQSSDGDATDIDECDCPSSRKPLSIVKDSSPTPASVDTAGDPSHGQPQQQQQRAAGSPPPISFNGNASLDSTAHSSNKSQRSNNNSGESTLLSRAGGSNTNGEPSSNEASRDYAHPLPSQRPIFYVYYHPLGDENKCVDRARKWIAKEQHIYHEWRESLMKTIVGHERRRESAWSVTEDLRVLPPQPRLEARRILPPALGEPVRWRNDDGSNSVGGIDVMELSPVTLAALHYYFGGLDTSGSASHLHSSSDSSKRGSTLSRRHSTIEAPPSFAATRTNLVSRKAKRMFKGDRQGAGTVVMPLRIPSETEQRPSTSSGLQRHTTAHRGATAIKVAPPRTTGEPHASRSPPPQQRQGNTSQCSVYSESSPNITLRPRRSAQTCADAQLSHVGDEDDTCLCAGGAVRDTALRRPRFRAGLGLALLDDSGIGSPQSGYCASEALRSPCDVSISVGDAAADALVAVKTGGRVGRTETLNPEAAEIAARNTSPSRDSSALTSPRDTRPSLPCFLSLPDCNRPASARLGEKPGAVATGAERVSTSRFVKAKRQDGNSPVNYFSAQLSEDITPPTTAADKEAEANNSGSFVARVIQSFCGKREGKVDNPSILDGDGTPPHVRDISSAPPQSVTYHRRNGPGNASFSNTSFLNSSSAATSHQRQLGSFLGHSKVAKARVLVQALQLTEKACAAAVQIADLLQQHGPTALQGIVMLLTFFKDNVFTPENVRMMETTITPAVLAFAVLALLYLLFFGSGGADEALPPLYSGSL